MKRRYVYHIEYRAWVNGVTKSVDVVAHTKAEAYDVAFYESIPAIEGELPYSAWVDSVTYQNGNYHQFNTSEGNAY